MDLFLVVLIIFTDVMLITIAVGMVQLSRRIRTPLAQLQAQLVLLLCVAGVVASIQDLGFHLTELGVIGESVGAEFVRSIQAVLVVGGALVLVPALFTLRKLTAEFARDEALSEALVNRLPAGLTLESAGLTKREIEVVEAVGAGQVSDRQIADELTISASTAATHVRNIMRKTGIRRRSDLALLALELGDGSSQPR